MGKARRDDRCFTPIDAAGFVDSLLTRCGQEREPEKQTPAKPFTLRAIFVAGTREPVHTKTPKPDDRGLMVVAGQI